MSVGKKGINHELETKGSSTMKVGSKGSSTMEVGNIGSSIMKVGKKRIPNNFGL